MTDQRVAESYNSRAAEYIELLGTLESVHADDLELIRRWAAPLPGPVLDVGCGPGHLSAYLSSLGAETTGVDLAERFVDHAKATYPHVAFELGSMASLAVADNSVTGILAWYSVIHVDPENLPQVLAELRRVLVPGGTLLLAFFAADELQSFAHKVVTAHAWSVTEMCQQLNAAGFDVQEQSTRSEPGARDHATVIARTPTDSDQTPTETKRAAQ